jgi:hypothetical protein
MPRPPRVDAINAVLRAAAGARPLGERRVKLAAERAAMVWGLVLVSGFDLVWFGLV